MTTQTITTGAFTINLDDEAPDEVSEALLDMDADERLHTLQTMLMILQVEILQSPIRLTIKDALDSLNSESAGVHITFTPPA